MYPLTCPACLTELRSKTQATHHRRLCRAVLVDRLVAVLTLPRGFSVGAAGLAGVSVYRLEDGRYAVDGPGEPAAAQFVSPDPAAAAGVFLDRAGGAARP